MAVLESKRLELEATGAKKIEIGRLIDQAVELAGEFKTAFAEGTNEEKRLFLRAFLKRIELDPANGKGVAIFILLPNIAKCSGRSYPNFGNTEICRFIDSEGGRL